MPMILPTASPSRPGRNLQPSRAPQTSAVIARRMPGRVMTCRVLSSFARAMVWRGSYAYRVGFQNLIVQMIEWGWELRKTDLISLGGRAVAP